MERIDCCDWNFLMIARLKRIDCCGMIRCPSAILSGLLSSSDKHSCNECNLHAITASQSLVLTFRQRTSFIKKKWLHHQGWAHQCLDSRTTIAQITSSLESLYKVFCLSNKTKSTLLQPALSNILWPWSVRCYFWSFQDLWLFSLVHGISPALTQ